MGDEMQKVKWILAAGFVFLVSAFFSFNELRYLIWGKTVETRVQEKRIVENTSRRGGKVEQLRVAYQFEDAGNRRSEYDMLPTDWPVPDEGNIAVQYIPGDPGSSRLAGHWSRMWVVIFLLSIAALAFFIYRLAREANEPIRPKRGAGRR